MLKLRDATEKDMPQIDAIALKFDLDSNDTNYKQFIVADDNGKIAGFGRLIRRENALELGTIGVTEEYRNKGIGKMIVNELVKRADEDLYITTLIPAYFEKFDFKKLDTPAPSSMIRKKEWCDGCKKVGCTVMKRKSNFSDTSPQQ